MIVLPVLGNYFRHYNQNYKNHVCLPAYLKYDTVSFTAMKKSKFQDFDLSAVEKFKAPIEKFKSYDDFVRWSELQLSEIVGKDYKGRKPEVTLQRNTIVGIWANYLKQERNIFTPALSLIIMNSITKDLEPDSDKLPPVLNENVLKYVVFDIKNDLKNDPKYKFDFVQKYEKALRAAYFDEEGGIDTDVTKWVLIPSIKHDPENYANNKDKLKTLSYKTWCTKSLASDLYLRKGDFHIYLEHGQPKLAFRFLGDTVVDIVGTDNTDKIPLEYLQIITEHIKNSRLKLSEDVKYSINDTKKIKNKIENIKIELAQDINDNNAVNIFAYFGLEPKIDKDNNITLKCYHQPDEFLFRDLGIDENNLFEKVVEIENDADFKNSGLKSLMNLREIGGKVDFAESAIIDTGKLEKIGGNASFTISKILTTGNIKDIGGHAYFNHSSVISLNKLKTIGKSAYFNDSIVIDLGDLERIEGNANFVNSHMTSLKNLKYIGKYADFAYSQIVDYGDLETVNGSKFKHK